MKRLIVLFAATLALGFNACEKHKVEDLPEEFRKSEKHSQDSTTHLPNDLLLAVAPR